MVPNGRADSISRRARVADAALCRVPGCDHGGPRNEDVDGDGGHDCGTAVFFGARILHLRVILDPGLSVARQA